MLDNTDWTKSEEVEEVRRSIAMLEPGAWVLQREPALQALDQLLVYLRAERAAQGPQPADLLAWVEARVQRDQGRLGGPRTGYRPGVA